MQANGNAVNERGLTTTEKYEDEESFTQMLERIGISARARGKLVEDDFTSIQTTLIHFILT